MVRDQRYLNWRSCQRPDATSFLYGSRLPPRVSTMVGGKCRASVWVRFYDDSEKSFIFKHSVGSFMYFHMREVCRSR